LPDGQISSSDLGALVMRAPPKTAPESPRGKTNFARHFKLMSLSGSPAAKISLSEIQKIVHVPGHPVPTRGAFRADRHDTRGGMWWTRHCRALVKRPTIGNAADGKGVWVWYPWAGAKSEDQSSADDGD
jgi:hypothetical protein